MPVDDKAWIRAMYGRMTEATLQGNIRQAAITLGWLYYHTHDSRRSDPGFPDTVLVRGERILYRELKTWTGKMSPAQVSWFNALEAAGADVKIWRPQEWGDGSILKELELG